MRGLPPAADPNQALKRWMLCAALAAVATCSFVGFGVHVPSRATAAQSSPVLEHVAPQVPVVRSKHALRHLVGDEWEDDDDGLALLVDDNSTDVDGGSAPTNADAIEPEETLETDAEASKAEAENVSETEVASDNSEGNDQVAAGGGLEVEVAKASDEDVDAAELEAEIETLNEEEMTLTDDDDVENNDVESVEGMNDEEAHSDGVVIISEDIGEKESELNPNRPSDRPPPPPLPPGSDEIDSDGVPHPKSTTSSKTSDGGHESKSEDEETDDTIFDDLMRGFMFATAFSVLAICVYRVCYLTCVKCGIVPDERVVAARLRRLKLKNKRKFNRNIPPLDTRLWGEWMKQREGVGNPDEYFSGGVWDSNMDDVERGKENDAWDDDDSESSIGIEFDNVNSIEMSKYHGVSSSDHVLEFGEGEELEDRSHDDRLFDNDGGQQLDRQASDFFNGHSRGGKSDKGRDKSTTTPSAFWDTPVEDTIESAAKDSEPANGDETQRVNAPDDDFFDALASAEPPSAIVNDQVPETPSREDSMSMSLIADENQGYDEETDLLGLRSDSPPPLDLELIEKQMVENMEKAKLF